MRALQAVFAVAVDYSRCSDSVTSFVFGVYLREDQEGVTHVGQVSHRDNATLNREYSVYMKCLRLLRLADPARVAAEHLPSTDPQGVNVLWPGRGPMASTVITPVGADANVALGREPGRVLSPAFPALEALHPPLGGVAVAAGGPQDFGLGAVALARAVGAAGAVHAFAEGRQRFQILTANVVLSGLANVFTYPHAADVDSLGLERLDMIRIGDVGSDIESVLEKAAEAIAKFRPAIILPLGLAPHLEAGGLYHCEPRGHESEAICGA